MNILACHGVLGLLGKIWHLDPLLLNNMQDQTVPVKSAFLL